MPVTRSAHPGEGSESSSLTGIHSGGNHEHFSNPVNNSKICLCKSSWGKKKKKATSIHALAMKLILMNTSICQ